MNPPSETYRAAGALRSWIPVFIVLLSIPPIVWALYQLPNQNRNAIGAAAWGIMLGGGLFAAIVAIVVSRWLAKRAVRKLADVLEAEGFTAVLKPTDDQRAATLEGMTPLALFESAGTLLWFAYRKLDGITLPAVVLQHSHIVGSGRTTREHFRTLVAWPVKQQTKPEIWMRRPKAGLYKLEGTAQVPDVLVGDETFDKAFLIQCPGDPDAPRRLLTRIIREFILAGPKRESWVLARGYACCIFHKDVAAEGLTVMLSRARRMAEMWERA